MGLILWVIVPYVTFTIFVAGTVWRFRHDQFGWTSRSSQLYESRLLRLGSPLFHYSLLMVMAGHFGGIVVPNTWTAAAGVSEEAYHFVATTLGTLAAVGLISGVLILTYRRGRSRRLQLVSTTMDKIMFGMLGASILSGTWATVQLQVFGSLGGGHGYDYRESISPWFRSLWILRPEVALMEGVPLPFQVHMIIAFLLFALWPFTRLVHAFSAPVGYLTRPYVVYRFRDDGGTTGPRKGWELPSIPGRTSKR
ncbi:respiratory nitrate reductase subunit gamma [Myceligenerans crystallogenes]|uniref:NarG-like domain-containing protein n=1 Tax=Myceligenerans crystallogenes TaxID=316335 RepID=A0ABN2N1Z1_9MICO